MKISIIAVGKIKEKFYRDAIAEYEKRLSRYCTFQITEVSDEKEPSSPSDSDLEICRMKEAERIDKSITLGAYLITLEIRGKEYTSESFADTISALQVNGHSHIQFVIGGSNGIHSSITSKAQLHLSFSKMTFPHQLMRVILTEQIYRAFRIIAKEPYHK